MSVEFENTKRCALAQTSLPSHPSLLPILPSTPTPHSHVNLLNTLYTFHCTRYQQVLKEFLVWCGKTSYNLEKQSQLWACTALVRRAKAALTTNPLLSDLTETISQRRGQRQSLSEEGLSLQSWRSQASLLGLGLPLSLERFPGLLGSRAGRAASQKLHFCSSSRAETCHVTMAGMEEGQ